jgi:twitching motility protein PilU
MNLKPYLRLMIDRNASDMFLTVGAAPKIKIEGRIQDLSKTELTHELVRDAIFGLMTEAQQEEYQRELDLDFAIDFENGAARFRVNAFYQQKHPALVLRYIPSRIRTIDEMKLPPVLKDVVLHKRGIVLLVGATGSGKSTTLAAMVDHRNATTASHIITIEDPVEFVHKHKKSIINQREVGSDTKSYARALKSAMREAPDVILVGEIRTRETMETALEMASTGHLAMSTLHSNNAYQALKRIVNMFPQDLHGQLFLDLSLNLRAIVSQRLLPSKSGKRVAAVEVMVNTPYVAELILEGKINEIPEAMRNTAEMGMQTFDASIYQLYKEGHIEKEDAIANAESRTDMETKIYFS